MADLLVTYFEMIAPPRGAALAAPTAGAEINEELIDRTSYLRLYRAVGEALHWDQRVRMLASELQAFLESPATRIFVLRLGKQPAGLCEFDGVGGPEVELTNFGLVKSVQGRGLGPWLLDRALRTVWSVGPRRIWLHTDTNDHPAAQTVYQRAGFHLYAQRIEAFPD